MVILWTAKAESDCLKKHPNKKPMRKAGKIATYLGEIIPDSGEIFEAFFRRGWLDLRNDNTEEIEEITDHSFTTERVKRWKELKELFDQGLTAKDIAKMTGKTDVAIRTFVNHWQELFAPVYGEIHFKPLKKNELRVYAFYKGENFITSGTIKEIAAETGLEIDTLRFYASNIHKKRVAAHRHIRGGAKLLIPIGEEVV